MVLFIYIGLIGFTVGADIIRPPFGGCTEGGRMISAPTENFDGAARMGNVPNNKGKPISKNRLGFAVGRGREETAYELSTAQGA